MALNEQEIESGRTAVALLTLYRDSFNSGRELTLEELRVALGESYNHVEVMSSLLAVAIVLIENTDDPEATMFGIASSYQEDFVD